MTTRIMVVDDEPVIGKLLIYQLSGFGYQVSYLQNGIEALQQLPTIRPQLVLLDVMMPLISGWELCRQIRACSSVPIIMLTAKGAESDIVAGLSAGADDYVTKPFTMNTLHARIEAVLRRTVSVQSTFSPLRLPAQSDPHLIHASEGPRRRDGPPLPGALPEERSDALPSLSLDLPATSPTSQPVRLGQHIRDTRIARGMTLHQIERTLRIRWEFLQAIEQENWGYMPRVQVNRILERYTDYLDIDMAALLKRKPLTSSQLPVPLQFAAVLALVLVLVVVGMYLL